MRCRNCGHQNPDENRFCGMCGNLLVGRPSGEAQYGVKNAPAPGNSRVTEGTVAPPVKLRQEPVEARQQPVEKRREVEPVAAEPARRSDKWWVDEGETTIGGPSFLGLSNTEPGNGGDSYLFQEEEERSHKATWVFLLVLLVLVGVVYAKWQPIRDYVLNTAFSHSRPQQAAPANSAPETQATPAGPTTTEASSDAQTPPITAEPSKAADQKTPDVKEGLPEGDKEWAANRKPGGKQAEKQPAAVKKDETSADREDAPAADEEKPASSAKKARAAPSNEGSELVSSGERYLYGRGVARSCAQAVSYFNAAAAKQNPQAFSHMGALYATGECVPMDRAVAYAWFRRAYAKEPGNHYFEQNLTMLWREMTPDERQRATGRQ